jgi:hypothetical protein
MLSDEHRNAIRGTRTYAWALIAIRVEVGLMALCGLTFLARDLGVSGRVTGVTALVLGTVYMFGAVVFLVPLMAAVTVHRGRLRAWRFDTAARRQFSAMLLKDIVVFRRTRDSAGDADPGARPPL